MYVNMTGHNPVGGKPKDRKNWPSLASMVSYFHNPAAGTPRAIRMPYSMFDNGGQQSGEHAGWMGSKYDPILVRTPAGEPWRGVNRYTDRELNLKLNLDKRRLTERRNLLGQLDNVGEDEAAYEQMDHYSRMAADMLLGSPVRDAYDLEKEDPKIRAMYGDHMGGQSLLLSRRLVEAGVPVVPVVFPEVEAPEVVAAPDVPPPPLDGCAPKMEAELNKVPEVFAEALPKNPPLVFMGNWDENRPPELGAPPMVAAALAVSDALALVAPPLVAASAVPEEEGLPPEVVMVVKRLSKRLGEV